MAPMFSAANSAYSADTARARPGFAFGPGSITNGEVRVRFARKAKSSAQLRSPHVVRVFDYGESDGALYLAMEWLDGETRRSHSVRDGVIFTVVRSPWGFGVWQD